jgi:hypothetical protein
MVNPEAFPVEAQAALNELVCELERQPFREEVALRAGLEFVLAAVADRQRCGGRPPSELYARLQRVLRSGGQGAGHVG